MVCAQALVLRLTRDKTIPRATILVLIDRVLLVVPIAALLQEFEIPRDC
jgi:hypothetical protein